MKSTRKYLLAVCAFAIGFAAPLIHAEQDAPPPPKKEGGPKGDGARMKEHLGLTDDQAEKIKALHAEERAQLNALREKEGDKESKREEMKKIRETTRAKVDAVLTPEQREKAAKMREKMKERMEERKGEKDGKGPKGPPAASDPEM
jgi:periplasmic protein CpxP/Spy